MKNERQNKRKKDALTCKYITNACCIYIVIYVKYIDLNESSS